MLQQIKDWIVYEGGVFSADDNHFGGDPNANPRLNLKIQQRPSELSECINFFIEKKESGEKIEYYAEIGACSGGTTYAMNQFLNFKELLIIDDGGKENPVYVSDRGDQLRGENLSYIPRVEIIGSSAEKRVIEHALNTSNIHKYDILFIDGDHSYEGVKNDTINYMPIVRNGGYIVFHDTHHISGIMNWVSEIPLVCPNLLLVKDIAKSDENTSCFPDGIGLTIFQKL